MKTLWKTWLVVTVAATGVGCYLSPEAAGPNGTVFATITLRFLS